MSSDTPQKRARLAAGISQVEIAAAAKVALNTVSRYELNPEAVQERKARQLDEVYRPLLLKL